MIAIKKTFRKFGEKFTLVTWTGSAFLYERTRGGVTYYEVWLKRASKFVNPFGTSKIRKYRHPSNEEFGTYAFFYRDKELAYNKLESL